MQFKQYLIETNLRTKKGSPIKRSKYGVGKDIGGFIYLHKLYVPVLPEKMRNYVLAAENIVYEQTGRFFPYNTVKVSKKDDVVSLINSPDFDTNPEPTVGDYVTVKVFDQSVKFGSSKAIWHHKWLWVIDEYQGFDVEESKERSRQWLEMDDVDFKRIGNRDFWNKTVASKLK